MREVDRLSTSGTYPALPMAAKRRAREDSQDAGSGEHRGEGRGSGGRDAGERDPNQAGPGQPRPAASLIDEYA
jgi:hypothetical protein